MVTTAGGAAVRRFGSLRSLQAALILACCVVVPLLFTLAQADVFALSKIVTLYLFAVLGLLVVCVRVIVEREAPDTWHSRVDLAVCAFLLLNLAACVFSIDPVQSFWGEALQYQGLAAILMYVVFFYLARGSLIDERRVALLFASIAAGGALVAAYAVLQRAHLDPIWAYPPFGRTFSTIGQPNALAAYLVLALPVAAALLPRMQTRWRQALIVSAIALMAAALASTKSRGGYAGGVVAAAILTVPLARGLSLRPRTVVIGATALVLGVLAVPSLRDLQATVWKRAWSSADVSDLSVRRHLDLWAVASAATLAHPLMGTGQETFPEIFPQYAVGVLGPARAAAYTGYRTESPHNVYLAIAAGAGMPALAAYLALLVGLIVTIANSPGRNRNDWQPIALAAVLAAAAGHIVTDAFMTAEVTGSWLFWVLIGAGFTMARTRAIDAQDAIAIDTSI